MIHAPKAVVAAVKAAEAKAISLAKPKKVKSASSSIGTKGKASRGFPIGIPLQIDEPNAFKNRQSIGNFDALCNKVVVVKMEGSREYQVLKLMGDAYLKAIVYSVLKKYNGNKNIEADAHIILDNDKTLPNFFDKHLAAKHDKTLPNEQNTISPHGKSDVVEALLELARTNKKGTFAFMFVIEELFVLAGKGAMIGK